RIAATNRSSSTAPRAPCCARSAAPRSRSRRAGRPWSEARSWGSSSNGGGEDGPARLRVARRGRARRLHRGEREELRGLRHPGRVREQGRIHPHRRGQLGMEEHALEDEGFKGPWVKTFVEVARENIVPPHVTIDGFVEAMDFCPDGAVHIREALTKAVQEDDGLTVKVQYIGAPRYRIVV